MSFLKQLLGKYIAGGHGGRQGKHGGGSGGHHGGNRYGYSDPSYNSAQSNTLGKNCSACNTINLQTAKFCQQCGKTFSSECTQCKTTLQADAKFCPQCGTARGA